MSHPIEELRARIDEVDRQIVAAVNDRLRAVDELWRLKTELGVDRLDPEREQRLREALGRANEGPLTAAGLGELVADVLALTKRELERRSGQTSGA